MADWLILLTISVVSWLAMNKKYKKASNPILMFNLLWSIIMFLSNLRLNGLYQYNENIGKLIVLGVLVFNIGAILAISLRKVSCSGTRRNNAYDSDLLNYNLLYILSIVCLLYFLMYFIGSVRLLISGKSLNAIRQLVQGQEDSSPLRNFVGNFIVLPSATAIEVLSISDFWFGKRDRKLFAFNIAIIIFRVISDAGRTPLFNFAIYMMVGYLIKRHQNNKNISTSNIKLFKKQRRKYYRFASLGALGLGVMSFSRIGSALLRNIYFYFSMSPVLFSYWKEQVDLSGLVSYGTASLNGFVFSIAYVIKNALRLEYAPFIQKTYDFIANTDALWQNIAPGTTKANAYVSAFWFMYLDGRITGVVIGMLLYGILLMKTYITLIKNTEQKILSKYLLLYQGLFFSFIRFPFAKPYYAIAYLLICFIAYRKSKIRHNSATPF